MLLCRVALNDCWVTHCVLFLDQERRQKLEKLYTGWQQRVGPMSTEIKVILFVIHFISFIILLNQFMVYPHSWLLFKDHRSVLCFYLFIFYYICIGLTQLRSKRPSVVVTQILFPYSITREGFC